MAILYEARDHILIHTGYRDPASHRHMAAHAIFALDRDLLVTAGPETITCRGILIPSGCPHGVDTGGCAALVFLFDSTGPAGRSISRLQTVPEPVCAQLIEQYHRFAAAPSPQAYRQFYRALAFPAVPAGDTDPRITDAMALIRASVGQSLTCTQAAAAVNLSPSRFSHLFRQQTGMTFSAYRLSQRLLAVYAQVLRGRSITEAALDAGFSDSAHFADVHRRLFGMPATGLTRDLQVISVE